MAKLVFVVAKVFAQAPNVTEVFTRVEKVFFMIIRVKAVYFNLFGGFTAFDCERSSSRFCQLCIFLGVAKCENRVKVNLLFRDFCRLLTFFAS
jgi:hypothetical protein